MSEKNERAKDIVMRLGMDGPIINHCVHAYRAGLVSWEEAMTEAVIVLAGQNKEQRRLLENVVARAPMPTVVMNVPWDTLSELQRKEIASLINRGLKGKGES